MKEPLEEFDGTYNDFDWDPPKREWTYQERGIDFADLHQHFFARVPFLRRATPRVTEQGTVEERWQALGPFGETEVLSVVYTERNEGSLCWIISARVADDEEREAYYRAAQR